MPPHNQCRISFRPIGLRSLEYFAVDNDWITNFPAGVTKDAQLESLKTYADYASKIWAAVLAAVLFLYRPFG
ncbi:MAG: hypothetical protein ABSF87_17940 [Xanthobacteraceae bacterium]